MRDSSARSRDWGATFKGVVDGWLFSDFDGKLPSAVIQPLENPDLYSRSDWSQYVDVVREYRSFSIARYGGREIAILTAKLGAPAVAMSVQAAAARGVRALVGVGYCGAVAESLTCGDILVPVGAVAADGTSAAYCAERYPAVADYELTRILHDADPKGVHDGLVLSLDAVFAQDSALVDRCRQLRVSGIDMETSALLTVSRLHGVRAATVLVASDHPGLGLPTDVDLLDAGRRRAMELALKAVIASVE